MNTLTSTHHVEDYQQIHDGIIHLLENARTETVRSINTIMTATYWEIGRRFKPAIQTWGFHGKLATNSSFLSLFSKY